MYFGCCCPGSISRPNHTHPRQSRVTTDHASVRLLRRVSTKVWLHHCVALLHRNLRLLKFVSNHRRKGSLLISLTYLIQKCLVFSSFRFCLNCIKKQAIFMLCVDVRSNGFHRNYPHISPFYFFDF